VSELHDHPSYRASVRRAFDDALFPEWTAQAECARLKVMSGTGGEVHDDFFTDDVKQRPRGDYDEWPSRTVSAMRICSTCPVRSECLEYALEGEQRMEKAFWLSEPELVTDDRRFGVYGGVPGRVRERFARLPNAAARCDEWFRAFAAKQRWLNPKVGKETTEGGRQRERLARAVRGVLPWRA
jgi:hypothetical protein